MADRQHQNAALLGSGTVATSRLGDAIDMKTRLVRTIQSDGHIRASASAPPSAR
jgi:hypothetical protein